MSLSGANPSIVPHYVTESPPLVPSMNLAAGEKGQRKGGLKCAYCERSFGRTEHLTRHERSHRNEKPFKCNYCDSTFARKDVIKRHHLRYHPGIPEGTVNSNISSTLMAAPDPPSIEQRQSLSQQQETLVAQSISMFAGPLDLDGYQDDFIAVPNICQPPLDPNDTIDAFLAEIEDRTTSNEMLFSSFGEISNEYLNMDIPITNSPLASSSPSSLLTELSSHQPWRGLTEISVTKRNQLVKDAEGVIAQVEELSTFNFPSCLTFERLFTSFFEIFPLYLPFIHLPTWRAEIAHPCLLQAMAALSSSYYKEHKTAQVLYRAARFSVIKHLESSYARVKEEPVWLIQTILILMAYGTSSGKYDTFNEALSWASLLANAARCKKTPEVNVSEADLDLFMTWRRWIDYETVVRTKSAVFCFLNNLSVCYNAAPALLNWEMGDALLPCDESDWACSTPESWFETRKHAPNSPVRFSEAFDCLLSPSPPPQAIKMSSFGAYVMLHAIVQQMWRFQQDMWMVKGLPTHLPISYIALQRWQVCWEENSESSMSPRNPYGAVSSNAAALLRLAHMRLYTDFSAVRSAILSHDVEKITQSMKGFSITISNSNSSLKTLLHAVSALRTRIKLGMALKSTETGSPNGLQIHLLSIECCLFSSAWMREVSTRPEVEWSANEKECVRFIGETLGEVELDQVNAHKPYSTQLVYAWALIFERCAIWGIQSVLADALNRFANSLS